MVHFAPPTRRIHRNTNLQIQSDTGIVPSRNRYYILICYRQDAKLRGADLGQHSGTYPTPESPVDIAEILRVRSRKRRIGIFQLKCRLIQAIRD